MWEAQEPYLERLHGSLWGPNHQYSEKNKNKNKNLFIIQAYPIFRTHRDSLITLEAIQLMGFSTRSLAYSSCVSCSLCPGHTPVSMWQ